MNFADKDDTEKTNEQTYSGTDKIILEATEEQKKEYIKNLQEMKDYLKKNWNCQLEDFLEGIKKLSPNGIDVFMLGIIVAELVNDGSIKQEEVMSRLLEMKESGY